MQYILHVVGASRTADAKELMYARQHTLLVAKAFSLQAIDLVHIDYKGRRFTNILVL